MGEYATYNGERIKIGTCEDMYYLRADQRHLVDYSFDGTDRFRFPWPDEDNIAPGHFESYNRTCALHGLKAPEGEVEHGTVQFVASAGYNVSLPCPEGHEYKELRIARNGFPGAVLLCQQRAYEGKLVGIVQCGGCGYKWRLETLEMAEEAAVALRSEADRRQHQARVGPHYRSKTGKYDEAGIANEGKWHNEVADRLLAGYE